MYNIYIYRWNSICLFLCQFIRSRFLFLDSRTSRLPKKIQLFLFEPKLQTAAYSTYFGNRLLNTTLIQVFIDIESVCERYWVWILNIKSAIKLKLWTLHSQDCTSLHDVKFINCMLCVSSRYKGLRVSARLLWLVRPDVPSAGRANYRHALIIPTCFNPRSDKPY